MDRKLIDYLPPVLREVLELKAINAANEPEIELAWDAVALLMANQFLDTADEWGVAVWEKELKIFPKDTDTLEVRKARIKAMWNLEIPYTIPWLRRWLTSACGPLGHEVTVDDYTIHIQLDYNVLEDANRLAVEILETLRAVRPSNMRMLIISWLQSQASIRVAACSEISNHIDVWPRLVNNLDSSGGFIVAGFLEYHTTVEIFPKGGVNHAG